jgi:hypothetical protein
MSSKPSAVAGDAGTTSVISNSNVARRCFIVTVFACPIL